MIEAKGVYLKYSDGTKALGDINLNVEAGELIYIIGPSGSGKTSLLNLLMGTLYPTKGELKVLNQSIIKGNEKNIRQIRKQIGPVFQGSRLIKGRTVLDNVILGMRFLDI